jgi:predicted small metal-binding protein
VKRLRCRDVGFDCAGEIHAESVEAVLQQAAQHVMQVHGYTEAEVTPEFVAEATAQIRDEQDAATKR